MSKSLESLIHAYARIQKVDIPVGASAKDLIIPEIFRQIDADAAAAAGTAKGTLKLPATAAPAAGEIVIPILGSNFNLNFDQMYRLLGAISGGKAFGKVRMIQDGKVVRFYDELNNEVDSLYSFYDNNASALGIAVNNKFVGLTGTTQDYQYLVHCIQTNFDPKCGLDKINTGNNMFTLSSDNSARRRQLIIGFSLLKMLNWGQRDGKLLSVDDWLADSSRGKKYTTTTPSPVIEKPSGAPTSGAQNIYKLLNDIVTELNKAENDDIRGDLLSNNKKKISRGDIDLSKYKIVGKYYAPYLSSGMAFMSPFGRMWGGESYNLASIGTKLEKQLGVLEKVLADGGKTLTPATKGAIDAEIAEIKKFEDRIKDLQEDLQQLEAVGHIVQKDLKDKNNAPFDLTGIVQPGGAVDSKLKTVSFGTTNVKAKLEGIFTEFSSLYGKLSKSVNRVVAAISNGFLLFLAPIGSTGTPAKVGRLAPLKASPVSSI